MKTIPLETINDAWDRLDNANEEETRALADRMQKEQPFIMLYLMAMDENLADEEEEPGLLLELGVYIFEIMSSVEPHLPQITGDDLESAEQANMAQLESLEEASEMEFGDATQALISGYNQMPLLGVVLQVLMSDYEDEPDLAPENAGMSLIYLKSVIDCLDQARPAA